jgi:antitoxin YefM
MNVISYSETCANLNEIMDAVVDDHTPVLVTRTGREAVVIVSLADWRSMEETTRLLSSSTNAARLKTAIEELDRSAGARPAQS